MELRSLRPESLRRYNERGRSDAVSFFAPPLGFEDLRYEETSEHWPSYKSTGLLTGANRPNETGIGDEFFANVVMRDNRIVAVN